MGRDRVLALLAAGTVVVNFGIGKNHEKGRVPRRIYNYERVVGRRPIESYLSIDRVRVRDPWQGQRDSLRTIVQKHILADAAQYPVASVSLHRVWAALIPDFAPNYWITAGYRRSDAGLEREPLIQIPLNLEGTTEQIAEFIGGPVGYAAESLESPASLESLTPEQRLTFRFTVLSAITIAVRDQMSQKAQFWR